MVSLFCAKTHLHNFFFPIPGAGVRCRSQACGRTHVFPTSPSTIPQPLLHVFLNPSPPVAAIHREVAVLRTAMCRLLSSRRLSTTRRDTSLFVMMSFVFCSSLVMCFDVPYPNFPLTASPPIFFLRTGTFTPTASPMPFMPDHISCPKTKKN